MTKNTVIWDDTEDWGYSKPFNVSVSCPKCKKMFDAENSTRSLHNDLIEIKHCYHHLRCCPYCDKLFIQKFDNNKSKLFYKPVNNFSKSFIKFVFERLTNWRNKE